MGLASWEPIRYASVSVPTYRRALLAHLQAEVDRLEQSVGERYDLPTKLRLESQIEQALRISLRKYLSNATHVRRDLPTVESIPTIRHQTPVLRRTIRQRSAKRRTCS
jgi:hypothetical protein